MSALFVSATGTDVGKTFVTGALIRHCRAQGKAVDAIKPVVTGYDPAKLATSDPGALLSALGREVTAQAVARMSPWRFAAPLSPDMAAAREGRAIDFAEVVRFCRDTMLANHGHLLIEGIGGVMVPLDASHTVLDLVTTLRLPLLLVAGSYVGTISHTLTALQVLARRNVDVAAIVVSESPQSAASLEETVATLARFSDAIDVLALPRLAAGAEKHAAIAHIAASL
jgi:dethiobiotin synthetase